MSGDESLTNNEMDFWTQAADADTRAVVQRNARIERANRVERIVTGLRQIVPPAVEAPALVAQQDVDLARTLLGLMETPTDANLAAAESFLAKLGR